MKDRIKKIRKELDLTQQKFADRLGVQRNTIAMYEMGRSLPSDAIMRSICREFNVNEEWLRTGQGEMFIQRTRNQTESEYNLFKILAQLNESDWELLLNMAKTLVKQKVVI